MTDPWDVTIDSDGTTVTLKVTFKPRACPHCGAQLCPVCGGELVHGPIPCPDGKQGCLVLHYGLRCSGCGAVIDGRKA